MQFPVSPEKIQALEQKFADLGIREADLDEQFIRSGGPGGQNVNKTSTCVVLTHVPSGLQVRCAQERSQGLNRFLARRRLAEKIEKAARGKLLEEERERYRIRKQKQRRSRRAKLKMLENKARRKVLKDGRKAIASLE